ncbi:SPBc2 prophage-derived aminoglycoside N(3')-acetyltransferase-like protein YokD [Clostridium tepidiprofundi DSM 19306]|uniref:Aminoglycoside N(3)-acetyltransferase n=1 Tax=Clostridium tepidiprofundi DSM 19306 TaxID=1121338 RepID=A0A151B4T4_9CLOT|nr:AAC(3) family N-acetyltransferase [Clostridium tepidiprofundi]KYH34813.1 SPBc2 prophage-derived aminoglycoside N(3')-acetyltransferase-like protein YokD [Clostridium tepidiprofundi DSM 19306]
MSQNGSVNICRSEKLYGECDKDMVLLEYNGLKISIDALKNSLIQVGIKSGDSIFVHSDIGVFGKLVLKDRNKLLSSFVKAMRETIGEEGNIIMPTFSYSFCKGEVFDVCNTKGTVGVLNEFFRKQDGVMRTIHPIFSSAVYGKDSEYLLDIDMDSFGNGSIFAKLHKLRGKIVFLGASFSSTYLHYIEQSYGVPYRYMKTFRGKIKNIDKYYECESTFFVRDLNKNVILDTTRLEKYLLDNRLMNKVLLGNGTILMVEADVLYNEVMKLLDKDIRFLLKSDR